MTSSDLFPSFTLKLVGAILACSLYPIGCIIYNLYLHPLSKFPGPKLWTAARFRYVLSIWSGYHHKNVQDLHRQYGDVVRIAPDEVSFARADAFNDIFSNGPGRLAFPKSELWHHNTPGRPSSVFLARDPKVHARLRRAIDPAFTEKAVRAQEPIIQQYVELFIAQLSKLATKDPKGAVVDIGQWFAFITFDLIGDLGFGETFGSLETSTFHPWIGILFTQLKARVYMASLKYYPALTWLLSLAMPKKVMKQMENHWNFSEAKMNRRLEQKEARPDMVSMIKRDDEGLKGLSRPELTATAVLLIVAGSETTATTLTGIINYVIKSPSVMSALADEVRAVFSSEADMTLSAVKDLPYLRAVIQEGLRLCNPAPSGIMRITPPEGGSVSGHWLPGNTYITNHLETLYHSPDAFHRAEEFLPERWLKQDPAFADDQLHAVQTFSVGPRSCIGRPLAQAELRLILARLVWRFDLQQVNSEAGRLDWTTQKVFGVVERKPFEVGMQVRKDLPKERL